jgi:ubiquinol-cytochrome c reductase cytochrome b subunit
MILAPAIIGILLLVLPLLNNRGERAPSRRPWSIAIVLLSVIMIGSLWIAGSQSPWSPKFAPEPLSAEIIGATNGPVFKGARLFQEKACLNCHLIEGHGGRRGPELTYVADKLTKSDMTIRIANGGVNMPAFGATLKPQEIEDLVTFLESRKKHLASSRP